MILEFYFVCHTRKIIKMYLWGVFLENSAHTDNFLPGRQELVDPLRMSEVDL